MIDWFFRALTGGKMVLKIIILQLLVAAVIVYFLKKALERELLTCLLEKLSCISAEKAWVVREVVLVTAGPLSGDDLPRLRAAIKAKFPLAEITEGEDRALWGGAVLRTGSEMIDCCLSTRIGRIFGGSAA